MLVFTFASNVSVQNATVTAGAGSATNFTVLGNEVTVNLTGVTNAQTITVKLTRVGDGTNTSDIAVSMGVLIGDTTENGTVNSSDIGQVQSQSGQPMTQDNFREDVTTNGALNSCDIALVQAQSGTALSVWHAMWTPIQPAKLTPLDVHVSVPKGPAQAGKQTARVLAEYKLSAREAGRPAMRSSEDRCSVAAVRFGGGGFFGRGG